MARIPAGTRITLNRLGVNPGRASEAIDEGRCFPGRSTDRGGGFSDPSPGRDEVVLEIKASGMCGSDLHIYRATEGAESLGLSGDEARPREERHADGRWQFRIRDWKMSGLLQEE